MYKETERTRNGWVKRVYTTSGKLVYQKVIVVTRRPKFRSPEELVRLEDILSRIRIDKVKRDADKP